MPNTPTDVRPRPVRTIPPRGGEISRTEVGIALAPWRLPLAQLLDSATPTGTFSHSFGMETALADGSIHDAASCAAWLHCYLQTTLVYNDALAMQLAAADPRVAQLCALSRELSVCLMAPEARQANSAIGRRLLQITAENFPGPLVDSLAREAVSGRWLAHPALVMAAVGHDLAAPWQEVCALYLHSCLTSLVQNAVRAVPLGQVAGQEVLTQLGAPIIDAVARATRADPADLGTSGPLLDVLQCEHETQTGRMFIS